MIRRCEQGVMSVSAVQSMAAVFRVSIMDGDQDMKTRQSHFKASLASAAAATVLLTAPAHAEFELFGGIQQVAPQGVSSSGLTLDGAALPSKVDDIDSDVGFFIGLGYHVTPAISVSLSYSTGMTHEAKEKGLDIGKVGRFDLDVWTLQGRYTFLEGSMVRPYVQLGAVYFDISSEKPRPQLINALGTSDISFSVQSTFGWLAGAGVDVAVSESVSLFGEVNATRVRTDGRFNVAGSSLRANSIEVDPFIYRVGVSYRF